jgi:hypothetical protein
MSDGQRLVLAILIWAMFFTILGLAGGWKMLIGGILTLIFWIIGLLIVAD